MIKRVDIEFIEEMLHNEINQLQNKKEEKKELEELIFNLSNTIDIITQLQSSSEENKEYTETTLTSLIKQKEKVILRLEIVDKEYDKSHLRKYRLLQTKLKAKLRIDDADIEILLMLLDKNDIGSITKIKALEYIKFHNLCFAHDRLAKGDDFSSLRMVTVGFEKYTKNKLNYKSENRVKVGISQLFLNIKSLENSPISVYKLLKQWEKYEYEDDELENIIICVLEYYQSKIYEQIKLISEVDFYFDIELSKTIKEKYEQYVNIYITVRNHYEQFIKEEIVIDEKPIEVGKKILLYSSNYNNISYLERDMDENGFPEEDFNTVMYLLNGFKMDTLMRHEIKRFNMDSICGPAIELRKSQVRIIVKQIKDNYYCVTGVGIKKADNDRPMYKRIGNRQLVPVNMIDNELEIAKQIESRLEEYVKIKARKGSR